MRHFLLLLLFLIITLSGTAQQKGFRFQQLLQENPDTPYPFSVAFKDQITLDQIIKSGVSIKYLTPKNIFVQATPSEMFRLAEDFNIAFHFELSLPQALNDTTREIHFVDQVHQGISLPQGYTGKDVIIGYIDTGLDFNHPDFIDSLGKTRVLRYWDHTIPGPNSPMPYGYGQLWDSSEINNGTCTSLDQNNHGTTVTGTGSGNGRANGTNMGMAPNSNIVIVEAKLGGANWTLSIADAIDYIFKVADTLNMPAVVNISLGTYLGSHDGNDPASDLIENLLDEKPGRLVVCAGGNSGAQGKYHQHGIASVDTSFVWFLNNPSNQVAPNSIYFDLWADDDQIANLNFAMGADNPLTYNQSGRTAFFNAQATANTTIFDTIYNANDDRIATVEYYTELIDDAYHMEVLVTNIDSTNYLFRFMSAGSGEYDLWSGLFMGLNQMVTTLPSPAQMPEIIHYQLPDSLQTIVSSWACSEKVITVANSHGRVGHINRNYEPYVPTDLTPRGKLSPNSSKGPNRLNIQKPDISASGDITLSAGPIALLQNPGANTSIDSGGWHVRNGGTSMASPVVAGIAGLYFERCRFASYQDFRNDIIATAFTDQYTGTVPNYAYGHGKIDAHELMMQLQNDPNPVITNNNGFLESSPASNYQWTLDGQPIPNETGPTLATEPPFGEFTVYTVSDDGCVSESNVIGVFVGLDELENSGVSVYPNPTGGAFTIISKDPIKRVNLIDMQGKRIDLRTNSNGEYAIFEYPAGSYLLEIILFDKVVRSKIVRM